jgi:hypothetical protein
LKCSIEHVGNSWEGTVVHFFCQFSLKIAMPKYIVERSMPGCGNMTMAEIQKTARTSCSCLEKMDPSIQWMHSYLTEDKVYSVYIAPNKELILEHGAKSGFPCTNICEVSFVFDSNWAKGCNQTK